MAPLRVHQELAAVRRNGGAEMVCDGLVHPEPGDHAERRGQIDAKLGLIPSRCRMVHQLPPASRLPERRGGDYGFPSLRENRKIVADGYSEAMAGSCRCIGPEDQCIVSAWLLFAQAGRLALAEAKVRQCGIYSSQL